MSNLQSGRAEALDACPWLCGAPTGPGTPFAWPVFFVVDSLRLLLTLGAAELIAISIRAISRSTTSGQKTRFAGAIGLQERLASAWEGFVARVGAAKAPWLRVVSASGREAVQSTYADLLDGRVAAAEGRVLAL